MKVKQMGCCTSTLDIKHLYTKPFPKICDKVFCIKINLKNILDNDRPISYFIKISSSILNFYNECCFHSNKQFEWTPNSHQRDYEVVIDPFTNKKEKYAKGQIIGTIIIECIQCYAKLVWDDKIGGIKPSVFTTYSYNDDSIKALNSDLTLGLDVLYIEGNFDNLKFHNLNETADQVEPSPDPFIWCDDPNLKNYKLYLEKKTKIEKGLKKLGKEKMTTVQLEVSLDLIKTALEDAGVKVGGTPDLDKLCKHLVKTLDVKEKKVLQSLKSFFSNDDSSSSSSVAGKPSEDDFSDQKKDDGTDSSDSSSSDSSKSEKKQPVKKGKSTSTKSSSSSSSDSSDSSKGKNKGKKDDSSSSSSDSSDSSKGKKGKKDDSSSSSSDSSDSSKSKGKEKKPTKGKKDDSSSSSSSSDSSDSSKPKGKKGKKDDSSSSSSDSSDSSKDKKKSKKSKKDDSTSSSSSEKEEELSSDSSDSSLPTGKGKKGESPKKKHSKKAKESLDSSDDSEPPEKLSPPSKSKKVKLEVVNKNSGGGKDWDSPPKHYTFAKKTNLLVYNDAVIAGWGKDGIRKLNKRDITSCENKGWEVNSLDVSKAKKKMDKLK